MSKNRSLFKTAGLIAVVTIFSKILGFARDVVIAKAYGATLTSDAFFYAYQLPALALILLGGLGGPFHTATVAIFSKKIADITKKPEAEVQKLFDSFFTLTAIGFAILSILIYFFSSQIMTIIASGATPEMQALASTQLKIMAPVVLIGGVIGILYGISNVYKEFFYTSLSPTVSSVATIAIIVLFGSGDSNGMVLAWGTLIGAVGQFLLQLPVFVKSGFSYKPLLDFKGEDIKKIGEILFPAMLGTTIGQINIYIDMFFASSLKEGAWSAVGYANRLFQFPVGILITAFLVPLFPMFSTYVGKKDWTSLKYYFYQGLSSLWFITFPILAFIIILGQDTITVLFQRGKFDHNATLMVTQALIFLSISIIAYVGRDTMTRIFYSFNDSRTPFMVAMFSILVKTLMNFLFVKRLGISGITLSTTIVTFVNFILLSILIKKKITLGYGRFVSPVIKMVLCSIIMSVFAYYARVQFLHTEIESPIISIIKLSAIVTVSLIIYFIAGAMMKIEAASIFAQKIKNRFKPNTPA